MCYTLTADFYFNVIYLFLQVFCWSLTIIIPKIIMYVSYTFLENLFPVIIHEMRRYCSVCENSATIWYGIFKADILTCSNVLRVHGSRIWWKNGEVRRILNNQKEVLVIISRWQLWRQWNCLDPVKFWLWQERYGVVVWAQASLEWN